MKANQQYFVKDFKTNQNRRGFDREIIANKLFSEFSEPIFNVENNKLKIYYKYLIQLDELNNQDLHRIGEILNLIHTRCSFTFNYWTNFFFDKYSLNSKLSNKLNEKKHKIKKIRGGFLHGDYRLMNILKTKEGIKIVDWEYFGINFIYWDIAILIADLRHRQYHKELLNLDIKHFFNGYGTSLTQEEKDFSMYLGAVDIIIDHLFPNKKEKSPIPKDLYNNFCFEEREYLINY
jgi:thiamine kinase-like enzyme